MTKKVKSGNSAKKNAAIKKSGAVKPKFATNKLDNRQWRGTGRSK